MKRNSEHQHSRAWLWAVIVAIVLPALVAVADESSRDAAISRNLNIFNSLYRELNTFYVDTIDPTKSIETAINAMLDDIDPYTEYIPASSQEDFSVVATGEYGGIGSYITERHDSLHNGVYISGPYAGSPAARAGLRSGDLILTIDGDTVTSMTTDQVSARLKGQANTPLTVTVVRPYVEDSVLTFNLRRETIKVDPVTYYGVTRGNIGYISLSTFNEHSAQRVKEALLDLRSRPEVENIVLDLRGNGGGVLEAAVQIVGLFVPKGSTVLTTRRRDKESDKVYKTTQPPVDTEIPLVVLIDGGSASASEITAGALQDLDRAVIMGARSYGKGLVQTTRQLPHDALLKVTIARYYLPSGRLIQEIDYSHRNDDGTYARTTQSGETRTFLTAHGREVTEGGGIAPDIELEYPELNRLVYNIVRDNWAFDFATRYAASHETAPAPSSFKITDEIFDDFKASIDPSRFHYDKVCETRLADLRKTAEIEGYMNDSTVAAFDQLEALLKHDLNHDLDNNRKEIAEILGREIMSRYYYQAGEAEYDVHNDAGLDRVLQMFATPGEWRRLLHLD